MHNAKTTTENVYDFNIVFAYEVLSGLAHF